MLVIFLKAYIRSELLKEKTTVLAIGGSLFFQRRTRSGSLFSWRSQHSLDGCKQPEWGWTVINRLIKFFLSKQNSALLYVLPLLFLLKGNPEVSRNFKKTLSFIKKQRAISKLSISPVNTLNFAAGKYFYKIGLDSHANKRLEIEHINWNKIILNKDLVDLFPDELSFQVHKDLNVLKIKLFEPYENQMKAIEALNIVLARFKILGVKKPFSMTKDMQNGLDYIALHYGSDTENLITNQLSQVKDNYVRIGPAHGDLHVRNILKDTAGKAVKNKIVLIDLDRFTLQGIQALDCIHFLVDYHSRCNKISWFEQLFRLHVHNWVLEESMQSLLACYNDLEQRKLLYIYLTDRVGKETMYYKSMPKKWILELNKILRMLKLEENAQL